MATVQERKKFVKPVKFHFLDKNMHIRSKSSCLICFHSITKIEMTEKELIYFDQENLIADFL